MLCEDNACPALHEELHGISDGLVDAKVLKCWRLLEPTPCDLISGYVLQLTRASRMLSLWPFIRGTGVLELACKSTCMAGVCQG